MDQSTPEQTLIRCGHPPEITEDTIRMWLNAVKKGYWPVVRAYLEIGMDINAQHGSSALIKAVEANDTEMALWLIRRGIDIELRDASDDTALQTALNWGNRREMIELLINHGANINCGQRKGFTPLIKAILEHDLEIVDLLLERGADPNFQGEHVPHSPVYYAHKMKPELFHRLVDAGANVNIMEDGAPLLHHCIWLEDEQIAADYVEHLCRAGVDVNVDGPHGWTAHLFAQYLRYDSVREVLEAHGAQQADLTPYLGLRACRETNPDDLKAWLGLGLDVNVRDFWGNTALIIAAQKGSLECIEMLLAAGADANIINMNANALM